MIKFKPFLNEARTLGTPEETLKVLDKVMKSIKPIMQSPLLWRGFKGANPVDGFAVINNKRDANFYGGAFSELSKGLVAELGIKNITFCTTDKVMTMIYGAPYIFVPIGDFKVFSSTEITDVWAINSKTPYDFEKYASVELLPLDVRTQSLINLAGKPEYKHYLDELIKGLSETYTNTVQAETEIIFDADEYCLIDASDILDIVPAWIEQKLGFSKNVIMKPEEQKIALEYKYSPEKLRALPELEQLKVKTILRKYEASSNNRVKKKDVFTYEFKFGEKLNTYQDIYDFLALFKSYLEWRLKKV